MSDDEREKSGEHSLTRDHHAVCCEVNALETLS